jgi:hypothetical protein
MVHAVIVFMTISGMGCTIIRGKKDDPKETSRRTEAADKAESPGGSAQHDKTPGSEDTLNAVVGRESPHFYSERSAGCCEETVWLRAAR